MDKGIPRALVIMGLLLAVGMSTAALIFGLQARHIGSGKQSISVKGLAEKAVKADYAEWTIGVQVHGPTFAEALNAIAKARPGLDAFLQQQGFDKTALREGSESVQPNMVTEELANGRSRQVQQGFIGSQDILVTSRDLAKVEAANKAVLQLEAKGLPVRYSKPLYLVSNLEEIKMSLIGSATQNAQTRAEEFGKNGKVSVGTMRSASQGAFYILPAGSSADVTEFGGTYDKTTINKTARVVVTIEYNIGN